jgi:predicted HTH domain antitoxin
MVASTAEVITLRLPREMLEQLDGLAQREHRDRSSVIRDLLERGVGERRVEHALELYRTGRVTGWKAAQMAGVSLWRFHEALRERGVLLQYSEHDLEEDLRGLSGD